MNSAALSIKVFGVYGMSAGMTLVLVPNILLSLFGFPDAGDFWVRVAGSMGAVVGFYYWACGVGGAQAFFKASIKGRFAFSALLLGLVLGAGAPWQLLIFAAVDVAGAVWTALALRSEAASATATAG